MMYNAYYKWWKIMDFLACWVASIACLVNEKNVQQREKRMVYLELATFVKSMSRPQWEKRKLFAQYQEGQRKHVERAFGVLQARNFVLGYEYDDVENDLSQPHLEEEKFAPYHQFLKRNAQLRNRQNHQELKEDWLNTFDIFTMHVVNRGL
ncbi:hypothetical protein PIB30_000531 [Stylosanthes scabra]|uniref:Uncharacterized protein n=1 Tax=Stylosanthes scabra TaxID=79078 RepID=A0ABU6W0Y3_9FABA|nr:hypothetical protein [Stylosanthes scabra]